MHFPHNVSLVRIGVCVCVCVKLLGLQLRQIYIAGTVHYGVFSLRPCLPRGTKFGPFRGRVVNPSEIKTSADNSFMWEVCINTPTSSFDSEL